MPFYTVFTPTYNRRHLLSRAYDSLLKQTCQDFEWVVVDDGSTDGTEDFIAELKQSHPPFHIRYQRQTNGGKHAAHNTALELAMGEAFFVLDSDDWLPNDALETLKREWDLLDNKDRFVGVFGLFSYEDGVIVGDRFPKERLVSNAIDLRYNLKTGGDKIGFNCTEILRKFPFPTDLGKTYVNESLVWNRISQQYDSLFINAVVGFKEYQPGGITDNSALNDYRNPEAGFYTTLELLNGTVRIRTAARIRIAARLAKCSLYARRSPIRELQSPLHQLLYAAALPAALFVRRRDRKRMERKNRNSKVVGGNVSN